MRSARKWRKSCRSSHQATTTRTLSKKPSANGQIVRSGGAAGVAIDDSRACARRGSPARISAEVDASTAIARRARPAARCIEILAQIVRQHGRDLGQRVAGGRRQPLVRPSRNPARAEHQRLDLLLGEHQRRQHEAGLQHIAQPGLALDRRALRPAAWRCRDRACGSDAELVGKRAPLTGRRWRRKTWISRAGVRHETWSAHR